jgi:hypothetical protein
MECKVCCNCAVQIEYSRTSMVDAKDKAFNVWAEINKTDEQVAKELTENADSSERANVFADSVNVFQFELDYLFSVSFDFFQLIFAFVGQLA